MPTVSKHLHKFSRGLMLATLIMMVVVGSVSAAPTAATASTTITEASIGGEWSDSPSTDIGNLSDSETILTGTGISGIDHEYIQFTVPTGRTLLGFSATSEGNVTIDIVLGNAPLDFSSTHILLNSVNPVPAGNLLSSSLPAGAYGIYVRSRGKSDLSEPQDWTVTLQMSTGVSDVTISAGATSGIATSGTDPITYSPTADSANINTADIAAQLDAGKSVIINTTNADGTQDGKITVSAAIVKGSGVDADITLIANKDIIVNANITNIGNGNISITAQGNASGTYIGLFVASSRIISTMGTGAIVLTGTGGTTGNSNYGVQVKGGTVRSADGDITITGTSNGSTGTFGIGTAIQSGSTVEATGSGNVIVNGAGSSSGGSGSHGVAIFTNTTVQANSGDLTLNGTAASSGNGVVVQTTTSVQSTSGNIDLTGTAADVDLFADGVTINSGSGNMTIHADDLTFSNSTQIDGSGSLTIQPRTASTTIGLGGGAGTLTLTDAELAMLQDGFSTITIGKSDAGNITVDTATFTDPLTLVTGGSIVDAGTGGPHITVVDLLLDSGTGVGSLADPVDIEVTNVAARATTSGGVFIEDDNSLTVKSVGGVNGISANGGDISVTANGAVAGNYTGITVDGSAITTLSAGAISLTGNGGNTGTGNSGILFSGTSPEISTVDGDITLAGATPTRTTGTSTNVGILSNVGIVTTIQATGSGNISLTGTSGGSQGAGIILSTGSTVQANTGNITIVGTGKFTACGFGALGTITSMASGNIDLTGTSDYGSDACMAGSFNSGPSGSFTVNANTVQIDASATVAGSGALTFAPRTASTTIGLGGGTGTLNLVDAELTQLTDGFSSITIGKSDAGNITVSTATFTDPLTLLTAGDIINANNGGTDLTATSVTFDGNVSPLGTGAGAFGVSGNTTFANNSSFEVDLTGSTTGGPHDQLNVTGSTTLGTGVDLTLDLSNYTTHETGAITIIADTLGLTGAFNGLAQGSQTNTSNNFLVGYSNSATLTAATPTAITLAGFSAGTTGTPVLPLAGTLVGLALAGLALLFVRRRSLQV